MSVSNGLPKGWKITALPTAATLNPSKHKLEISLDTEINFVPMPAVSVEFGGIDISSTRPLKEIAKGYTQFAEGDVLFAKITPCMENGKIAIVPKLISGVGYGSTEFHVLRPHHDIDAKWIAYFLSQSSIRRLARRNMTGSAGQLRVPTRWLEELPLPIAPLNEQRRIVAKIEEVFSDLDAGVAALERAKANLKRYRASVLKAAVEGKLTEDWRKKHPKAEPAAKLLERILTERRKKWEADQLAKFKTAGKEPPKGWKEKYKEPSPPDTADLPELPEGWCWASVEQIGEVQGGIQKQPKRAPKHNAFPFLRVANVHRNRLYLGDVHKIEVFGDELEKLRLKPGDMLIVEGNGSKTEIGRSAIWDGTIQDCVHQNHIIRVRFLSGDSRYPNSYWNSPVGNGRVMQMAASTSGLYTLSVTKVNSLPIPLPPLDEQDQVISVIEEKLSLIDAAETAIEHGLKRAARLRQSILKQAFEGKLVPQDPADEPASVLLERIKANADDIMYNDIGAARGREKKKRKQLKRRAEV